MFLDTEILISGGVCQTRVYRKPNKLPLHWHSKTPVRYKRNAITGDLYRAKRISSVYQEEVTTIYNKFVTAGFPERFVASVIDNFNNSTIPDDNFLIPPYFFEEPTPFILVEIPYCPENERLAKHFITKFKSFIDAECTVVVKWVTRKIKTLFSLKAGIHTHLASCTREHVLVGAYILVRLNGMLKCVGRNTMTQEGVLNQPNTFSKILHIPTHGESS